MDLLLNTAESGWNIQDKGKNCWVMMNTEEPSLELEKEYPPDCNLSIRSCQVAHRRCNIFISSGCHTRELMDLQLTHQIDPNTVPYYAIMDLKESWTTIKLSMGEWSNQEVETFLKQQARGRFSCSEKDLTRPMYLLLLGMLKYLCQIEESDYIGPKMCGAIEELTAIFPHETHHEDLEYQNLPFLPYESSACVDSLRIRCSPLMIKIKKEIVKSAVELRLAQAPDQVDPRHWTDDEEESEAEEEEKEFMGLICLTDPSADTNDGNSEEGTNDDLRKQENTVTKDNLESIDLQEVEETLDKKEESIF
jgi:chorismate mutase